MPEKLLILSLCLLLTVQAMAQTEDKKEILTNQKKELSATGRLLNPARPLENNARLPVEHPVVPPDVDTTTRLPSSPTISFIPFSSGNNAIFPLSKNTFFYLEGEQQQYLNLASYRLAYLALGWHPYRKLNLTGGMVALKQFTTPLPYGTDRFGVRFNLNYSITNQLHFSMWGQYLNGTAIPSPADFLLPQTGTGASMLLDFGGTQLGVGAAYQYDPHSERWNYQSGGKVKVKF